MRPALTTLSRCYTFWVGVSLLLLGSHDDVDLGPVPAFCSGCRGEHGCGYVKDLSSDSEFDLMHTHMCSLGLYCLQTVRSSRNICNEFSARLRLRALENAALCVAVEDEAAAVSVDEES
jgi:prenyltransferase beta subunit